MNSLINKRLKGHTTDSFNYQDVEKAIKKFNKFLTLERRKVNCSCAERNVARRLTLNFKQIFGDTQK